MASGECQDSCRLFPPFYSLTRTSLVAPHLGPSEVDPPEPLAGSSGSTPWRRGVAAVVAADRSLRGRRALSETSAAGSQDRVWRDQRAGVRAFAAA